MNAKRDSWLYCQVLLNGKLGRFAKNIGNKKGCQLAAFFKSHSLSQLVEDKRIGAIS
jgi:hypothetical protein